ncbi:unnamed protein product [Mytilus coruscus]|uniref:Uncharacterized protein n=1 Tax=Mytilus coruscus TaxID=42192 RepID=A0A6J8ANH3_MYTCO|nr:unnamed protein product [Mytilus coruscus]
MELGRKLKLCVAISVLALIFKIIATASPGWVVVHTNVYFDPKDDIRPEEDGLRVDESQLMKPRKERVTISFGLWYYKVCKCGGGEDDDDSSEEKDSSEEVPIAKDEAFKGDMDTEDEERKRHHHHHKKHHHGHHRCYHRGYHCDKKRDDDSREKDDAMDDLNDDVYKIPTEFYPAAEFIKGSVDVARRARHELAWYAAVGLVLGLVGFIGAVFYARGGGMGKHPGRLACSTQILSAFFFWMVIIRVASYYMMLKKMHHHGGDNNMLGLDGMTKDIEFGCPWCPWVAAVGASAMALASLFHMMLISRDRSNQRSEYSFHTHNDKIPIIAPRGYDQLVVPPMYEEAGPLPEKKVIP